MTTLFDYDGWHGQPAYVMLWLPPLTFKLGGQGSNPSRTYTQGRKIIEEKGLSLH